MLWRRKKNVLWYSRNNSMYNSCSIRNRISYGSHSNSIYDTWIVSIWRAVYLVELVLSVCFRTNKEPSRVISCYSLGSSPDRPKQQKEMDMQLQKQKTAATRVSCHYLNFLCSSSSSFTIRLLENVLLAVKPYPQTDYLNAIFACGIIAIFN